MHNEESPPWEEPVEVSDAPTVVVVCGSGAATSFVVAKKVTEYLASIGINAKVTAAKVSELDRYRDAKVIVATAEVPSTVKIPVVAGLPLLTGIGESDVFEAVAARLRQQP